MIKQVNEDHMSKQEMEQFRKIEKERINKMKEDKGKPDDDKTVMTMGEASLDFTNSFDQTQSMTESGIETGQEFRFKSPEEFLDEELGIVKNKFNALVFQDDDYGFQNYSINQFFKDFNKNYISSKY